MKRPSATIEKSRRILLHESAKIVIALVPIEAEFWSVDCWGWSALDVAGASRPGASSTQGGGRVCRLFHALFRPALARRSDPAHRRNALRQSGFGGPRRTRTLETDRS